VGRWMRGPHEWLCSDRADAIAATVRRVRPPVARRPRVGERPGEVPPC
jgi:hypothetical protein